MLSGLVGACSWSVCLASPADRVKNSSCRSTCAPRAGTVRCVWPGPFSVSRGEQGASPLVLGLSQAVYSKGSQRLWGTADKRRQRGGGRVA